MRTPYCYSISVLAFEQGIEFAYRFGKVNGNHLQAYARKSFDRDCFVSGYLKVIQTPEA